MKTFTINDIRSWEPCHDPASYVPETWTGTAIDMLNIKKVPISDRFWAVLRTEVVPERTLRLFAVWCAREASSMIDNLDPRSIKAINVAESYAKGQATEKELLIATRAAFDAHYNARSSETWVSFATGSAAQSTADCAEVAAELASKEAAYSIAHLGAQLEPYATDEWEAIYASLKLSVRLKQLDKLIEMINEENKP